MSDNKSDNKVRLMITSASMMAIVFVTTFINFTVPLGVGKGCLVHLGAASAVAVAFMLPPLWAGLSAGLGMCLFDFLSGWVMWAPFTLIIRFAQIYILSKYIRKNDSKFNLVLGFSLSFLIDVCGYYLAESIIYLNLVTPLANIPAEMGLNIGGIIIGSALISVLRGLKIKF